MKMTISLWSTSNRGWWCTRHRGILAEPWSTVCFYHCPDLGGIGGELRPGIVHRLDKDTSGTMIVAKNDAAHHHLSRQFKSRQIKKEYLALVHGILKTATGSIKLPIGRHPVDRKRMSTVSPKGPDGRNILADKRGISRFYTPFAGFKDRANPSDSGPLCRAASSHCGRQGLSAAQTGENHRQGP